MTERLRFDGQAKGANRVPKLCGADVELGNTVLGLSHRDGSGWTAARRLLQEFEGYPGPSGWYFQGGSPGPASGPAALATPLRPAGGNLTPPGPQSWGRGDSARAGGNLTPPGPQSWGSGDVGRAGGGGGSSSGWSATYGYGAYRANAQDWGRKYLASNGGCVYIDLDHLELCLPEVLSAYDHVAAWHAMLRLTGAALKSANQRLPSGQRIQVLVNNSDGNGNSYGSHLNFLVSRAAWNDLYQRRLHRLLHLASFSVSSIIFAGQGKVGSENGAPSCDFQLSQRADFMETLVGSQTTFNRPLVNSRDEPLAGPNGRAGGQEDDLARMHCIFYDSTLCHVACLLKVGVMQMILAMLEAGEVNLDLILDSPLEALACWSRGPQLRARSRTVDGKEHTAVEHQLRFLEDARRFHETGGFEGIVPHADRLLAMWEETLGLLAARDWTALAPRLDWVLKRTLISQALGQRNLPWSSPEAKVLDHYYGALDDGLFRAYDQGFVEHVVSDAEILHLESEPPPDTRAWGRAMLLRRAGAGAIDDVDWDAVVFRRRDGFRVERRRIWLASPLGFTRTDLEPLLESATSLEDLIDGLEAREAQSRPDPGPEHGDAPGEPLAFGPPTGSKTASETGAEAGGEADVIWMNLD